MSSDDKKFDKLKDLLKSDDDNRNSIRFYLVRADALDLKLKGIDADPEEFPGHHPDNLAGVDAASLKAALEALKSGSITAEQSETLKTFTDALAERDALASALAACAESMRDSSLEIPTADLKTAAKTAGIKLKTMSMADLATPWFKPKPANPWAAEIEANRKMAVK